MGLWSRFSSERLERSESKLMEFSGVSFEKERIEISEGNFMYCLRCGDKKNPPLVLVHGYCGAGLIFYKILKSLTQYYYIYLVDQIGMGRSSRPSFKALSTFEAEAFFIEAFETFREIVGLDKFVLAGHSFGGYTSACYALKYSQHVTKLLLLSPAGVTERPEEMVVDDFGWKFRWLNKFLHFFWVKNISLMEILRKTGPFTGMILSGYMNERYSAPKAEMKAIADYLEQVNLLPGSGEHGISYILDFTLWPYSPLSKRLPDLKIPIAFYYGDRDWVVPDGAHKMKNLYSNMMVYTISDSDHHMYWDNPEELSEKMLEALHLMDQHAS